MPSVTKLASFHSASSSSSVHKRREPPSPGLTGGCPRSLDLARPTLPDVRSSQPRWTFFHTLLDEDLPAGSLKDSQTQATGTPHVRDSNRKVNVEKWDASGGSHTSRKSGRAKDMYGHVGGRDLGCNITKSGGRKSMSADDYVLAGDSLQTDDSISKVDHSHPNRSHAQNLSTPRGEASSTKDFNSAVNYLHLTTPGKVSSDQEEDHKPALVGIASHTHFHQDDTAVKETDSAQQVTGLSQWTSCRALNNGDENSDTEDDESDELNQSKVSNADVSIIYAETFADGLLSRSTSVSNVTGRRKRPLLLPPIMLPPIYSVKPTPLVVRDEGYFTKASLRARRPFREEQWEQLKDCRYLRLRPRNRSLRG